MAGVKAFFLLQNAEGLIQLADPMRYCESVRSETSLAPTFPSLPEEIDGGNDLRQTLATIAPACLPVLEQRFQSGSVRLLQVVECRCGATRPHLLAQQRMQLKPFADRGPSSGIIRVGYGCTAEPGTKSVLPGTEALNNIAGVTLALRE